MSPDAAKRVVLERCFVRPEVTVAQIVQRYLAALAVALIFWPTIRRTSNHRLLIHNANATNYSRVIKPTHVFWCTCKVGCISSPSGVRPRRPSPADVGDVRADENAYCSMMPNVNRDLGFL
jgi:hypothetical protein